MPDAVGAAGPKLPYSKTSGHDLNHHRTATIRHVAAWQCTASKMPSCHCVCWKSWCASSTTWRWRVSLASPSPASCPEVSRSRSCHSCCARSVMGHGYCIFVKLPRVFWLLQFLISYCWGQLTVIDSKYCIKYSGNSDEKQMSRGHCPFKTTVVVFEPVLFSETLFFHIHDSVDTPLTELTPSHFSVSETLINNQGWTLFRNHFYVHDMIM